MLSWSTVDEGSWGGLQEGIFLHQTIVVIALATLAFFSSTIVEINSIYLLFFLGIVTESLQCKWPPQISGDNVSLAVIESSEKTFWTFCDTLHKQRNTDGGCILDQIMSGI